MTDREQFEAWAKVRYAKNPHFWLRQIDDGGYSCGMADAAWAAWQVARAQPAITPETGNAPPQGASAITSETVPLLTEQEIVKCLTASGCVGTIKMSYDSGPYEITRTSINADRFARAIEAAVRAKLGAGVPMTDPQLQTSEERRATGERIASMIRVEEVGADLIRRARDIVVGHQKGSISLVQRQLRISYNTAAKLLEALEQEGVVSPQRQNGQREVLVLPDISGIVGKEGA